MADGNDEAVDIGVGGTVADIEAGDMKVERLGDKWVRG